MTINGIKGIHLPVRGTEVHTSIGDNKTADNAPTDISLAGYPPRLGPQIAALEEIRPDLTVIAADIYQVSINDGRAVHGHRRSTGGGDACEATGLCLSHQRNRVAAEAAVGHIQGYQLALHGPDKNSIARDDSASPALRYLAAGSGAT